MHSHLIITPSPQVNRFEHLSPFPLDLPHPDKYEISLENPKIGIQEVRDIKSFLIEPPLKATHKVIYIPEAQRLTPPAQNALLKTLEEPPEYATLILTAPNTNTLLSTITSRCQITYLPINNLVTQDEDITQLIKQIIDSSPGEKISLAEKHAKPREKTVDHCTKLLHHFHFQLHQDPTPSNLENLKVAEKSLHYLNRNTNPQLTLEHLYLKLK